MSFLLTRPCVKRPHMSCVHSCKQSSPSSHLPISPHSPLSSLTSPPFHSLSFLPPRPPLPLLLHLAQNMTKDFQPDPGDKKCKFDDVQGVSGEREGAAFKLLMCVQTAEVDPLHSYCLEFIHFQWKFSFGTLCKLPTVHACQQGPSPSTIQPVCLIVC